VFSDRTFSAFLADPRWIRWLAGDEMFAGNDTVTSPSFGSVLSSGHLLMNPRPQFRDRIVGMAFEADVGSQFSRRQCVQDAPEPGKLLFFQFFQPLRFPTLKAGQQ